MSREISGSRINVRLSEREHEKVRVVADELFDGNEHEALRFAVRSLQLVPRGVTIEIGSSQSKEMAFA